MLFRLSLRFSGTSLKTSLLFRSFAGVSNSKSTHYVGSYYDQLHVEENASSAEIKAGYQKKIKEIHPDRNRQPDVDQFIKTREAFEVLNDPLSKRKYDIKMGFNLEEYGREDAKKKGDVNRFEGSEHEVFLTNTATDGDTKTRTHYRHILKRSRAPGTETERQQKLQEREIPVRSFESVAINIAAVTTCSLGILLLYNLLF